MVAGLVDIVVGLVLILVAGWIGGEVSKANGPAGNVVRVVLLVVGIVLLLVGLVDLATSLAAGSCG